MKETWQGIAQTALVRLYQVGISVICLTLTARWLGAEGRGIIAVTTGWVSFFYLLSFFSLGQVAVREAVNKKPSEWLPEVLPSLLVFAIFATLASWVAAAAIFFYWRTRIFQAIPPLALLIGFFMLPFQIIGQYVSTLLFALDRVHVVNRSVVLAQTAFLLLIVLLCLLQSDASLVLTAYVALEALIAALPFQ